MKNLLSKLFIGIGICIGFSMYMSIMRAITFGDQKINCEKRLIDSLEPLITTRYFCPLERK